VIEELSRLEIATSVHFIPLHLQPYWRDRYEFTPSDFPAASELFAQEISLPIFPSMTDAQVARVIAGVREALDTARRD
jgi:dTDP-4-amino-4,6-dideoxygalactose transaminase